MSKGIPIQLTIPSPCSQSWDEMTPDGCGHYCAHCEKTVIDFTTWTDAAIYIYFLVNKGPVCGRLLDTQLNRPFALPHQPHSRLYRIAIALGLTVIFTQGQKTFAQSPVRTEQSPFQKQGDTTSNKTGGIFGIVLDEKKETMLNAVVQVYLNGVLKGGTVTDFEGKYSIKQLQSGIYNVMVVYLGYDSLDIRNVSISQNMAIVNCQLHTNIGSIQENSIRVGYIEPLLDRDNPGKRVFRKNEIDHFPK